MGQLKEMFVLICPLESPNLVCTFIVSLHTTKNIFRRKKKTVEMLMLSLVCLLHEEIKYSLRHFKITIADPSKLAS